MTNNNTEIPKKLLTSNPLATLRCKGPRAPGNVHTAIVLLYWPVENLNNLTND